MQGWDRVRVRIHGQGDAAVPQPFLHNLWIDALGQKERAMIMSKVVEPYLRKAILYYRLLKMSD